MKKIFTIFLLALAPVMLNAQILFDNGPVFNSVGTGSGGADESVLYTTTFAMGTIGFGAQSVSFNRVADDFTVTGCYWKIDSVAFFCYQTGSTTTSTITAINVMLWDSIPYTPAWGNVIFGDTTTNRMIRTAWSGVYRITETTTGNTQRPIMRSVVDMGGLIVPAGDYWLDWSFAGSLASGPWQPPRTPAGVSVTGNGLQRLANLVYNNAVDGGTGLAAQGFPFVIYGTQIDLTADAGPDYDFCEEAGIAVLGGSPAGIGGLGTLVYNWTPSLGLSSTSVANPGCNVPDTVQYFLEVTDSLGCVRNDTVMVNVTWLNELVNATDSTLAAMDTSLSYQWVDCLAAYAPVPGANGWMFMPAVSGTYAVVVNQGTCYDTSACFPIVVTGLDENFAAGFSVSPNPAGNVLNVFSEQDMVNAMYEVYDYFGRLLIKGQMTERNLQIDLSALKPGVFTLRISDESDQMTMQFVKY